MSLPTNELNTKVRVRNVKTILSNVFENQDVLLNSAYSTELTFDTDKDIYQDLTGLSPTFTLAASGNINGKGIFLRLNKPTAVTFPGTFEASSGSAALDATKLNVYLLIFFTNWNGSGVDHVVYSNQTFTAL